MDSVGGARILSERFGDAEQVPFPTVETVDALPLFHWTGVEPVVRPPRAARRGRAGAAAALASRPKGRVVPLRRWTRAPGGAILG